MIPRPLLAPALLGLALVGWSDRPSGPAVSADRLSLSLSQGGEQVLQIDAGAAYAGHRYLVVGSASGTFPGTLSGSARVPLNYDSYTEQVLVQLHGPNYSGFSGYLDASGRATARLRVGASAQPTLVGKVYHHAAVVLDPKTRGVIDATNAAEVLLLP